MPLSDPENTPSTRAHRATATASEGTRQTDAATALATFNAGGTYAAYAAAVKASDIAHHRRIVASALANGLPAAEPSMAALHDLGTGGV